MGDRQYNRNKYKPVKTSGNRVLPNGSIVTKPNYNRYLERK